MVELVANFDSERFQIHPGMARKNGTWKRLGGCPLPAHIRNEDGCDGDCPVFEMGPGNRRYRAISLLGAKDKAAGLSPLNGFGVFTFTVRAMSDSQLGRAMASENNQPMRQSRIEQIRQGMLFRDAPEESIRACFSELDFGKKIDPVNVIRVLAECEELIWVAFADRRIGLGEAEEISRKARSEQAAELQKVIAAKQEALANRPPPPRPLKPESRQKLIGLLEALFGGGCSPCDSEATKALLAELRGS
jgi:hypothetical protein